MATFPILKTGAVMQYPARKVFAFSTQIHRFLDGSEQRYRDQKAALRRWVISLSLLDETEVTELDEFFLSSQGEIGSFEFFDPWEEVLYQDCSFENEQVAWEYAETGDSRGKLVVRQNWS